MSYLCYFCFSSPSADSIGTSLASQSSHLKQRLLLLAGEPFPILFQKKGLHFPFFLCLCVLNTYEHVIENLLQAQHSSTAQSSLHKAAKRVHQSATTQSSSVGESRYVVKHLYRALRFKNEAIDICPVYKNCNRSQSSSQLVWGAKDLPLFPISISIRYYAALSLHPFYFVRACGVRVVFLGRGALGSCMSSVCT